MMHVGDTMSTVGDIIGTEHPHGTHDIAHMYHDIPHGTQITKDDIPHGTEHTLYRVFF